MSADPVNQLHDSVVKVRGTIAATTDVAQQRAIVEAWLFQTQSDLPQFSILVFSIYQGLLAQINAGLSPMVFNMPDHSINVGGNMIGSQAATGNAVQTVTDNQFDNRIDNSSHIQDQSLRQSLKMAREAIMAIPDGKPVKQIAIQNFGNLVMELEKAHPDKTTLEVLWGGLKKVAEFATPVLELGAALAKVFGIIA